MELSSVFCSLFERLREVQYHWSPQSPQILRQWRENKDSYSYLNQYFGLGILTDPSDLEKEGLERDLFFKINPLRLAVSQIGTFFVPHHHYNSVNESNLGQIEQIYFGPETLRLYREIEKRLDPIRGKRVLDLGSGAGALSLELGKYAKHVLGLEINSKAVEWANAAAKAQGCLNVNFLDYPVGDPLADRAVQSSTWDVSIFNPPFMIPHPGIQLPHRDGGKWGIEIPLRFLDFSWRHLVSGGEVLCLMGNPIYQGRSILFEELKKRRWITLSRTCLEPYFNQSTYRKEGHFSQGLERVELYFLHLRKS